MITWLKRLLLLALLLVMIIAGVVFTSENDQLIQVTLFGHNMPELQFGLWLVMILLLGSILGLVLSLIPNLRYRSQLSSKERKIRKLEKELNRLRTAAING